MHERHHAAWSERIRARPDVTIFPIRAVGNGELIGSCQPLNIDLKHSTAQLQIRIGLPDERGKGYGTEAVKLLLAHAFRATASRGGQLHEFRQRRACDPLIRKGRTFGAKACSGALAYIDGQPAPCDRDGDPAGGSWRHLGHPPARPGAVRRAGVLQRLVPLARAEKARLEGRRAQLGRERGVADPLPRRGLPARATTPRSRARAIYPGSALDRPVRHLPLQQRPCDELQPDASRLGGQAPARGR